MVHGDLGIAYQGTTLTPDGSRVGTPVGPAVVRATLVTGALVIGGALLALLISIPLGAIAAAKPRSATDRTILAVSLVGICTHPLVVALLLQQFPGNRWGIAPARGYCPFFGTAGEPGKFDGFSLSQDLGCAGPTAWASHLILPWITFSLFFVAIYTRLVRVRMIEVMDEPYIRTAEAKGMPRARVVRHHALRNAMSPVLTLVGMDIGLALGIALYVESVYRLPGLGLTTLSALNGDTGFDLPMILGVVLVIGLVIVVANFIIDLVVSWMDPRRPRPAPAARSSAASPERYDVSCARAHPARLADVPGAGHARSRLVRRHPRARRSQPADTRSHGPSSTRAEAA